MRPRTIKYYLREALRSLVVNRLMSLASIFAVASSIFIVALVYILGANVEHLVRQLGDTLGLVVIVDEDLTHSQQQHLYNQINQVPHVATVTFVSRAEALENFRHMLGDNESLIRGLEYDNPMRDSFVVELTDMVHQEAVVRMINQMRNLGVDVVRSDADIVAVLTAVASVVQAISAILVFILGIISITIIVNTIRITVNARKTEINVMKYVGATDWFIRTPFVIEGILIGLIGGAIPAVVCLFGYPSVVSTLSEIPHLAFIQFLPEEYIRNYVFPFSIVLGTLIGLIGSGMSVRKHLKV